MNTYLQILEVKPRVGSPDIHRFKTAVVRLYARADSEKNAAAIMLAHLDRQDWEILTVHEFLMLLPGAVPYSEAVRERLDELGYCADIHHTEPPEDIIFSKS